MNCSQTTQALSLTGRWQDAADFAEAYVNWGGYAYTGEQFGVDARDDFRTALGHVAVAVRARDNCPGARPPESMVTNVSGPNF